MKRLLALLSVPLLAAACGGENAEPTTSPQPAAEAPVDAAAIVSGVEAYEQVCARCHEEGRNGAPRTGDREAWAGRSTLWEAVLFEHANDGYLDMPAKGGADELPDATVRRAAEYMLSLTYPDARTN